MQLRQICKSKIHRATVTFTDVNYIGSIGIDSTLMERANLVPGERVCVWNVNNGERIETYAIPAPPGSGEITINGAAARKFQRLDVVIIVAFVLTDEVVEPRMILVDEKNVFVKDLVDNRPGA
ncbi:MAG TPA: aspartate 1-decarboxylase [Blastocatellia bacterium]|nr:aspartate 1-decarboxylase [Blastocatellia bacterium]